MKKYKKRITPDIRSLCRAYTGEGTRVLASIMRDENVPAMSRVAAVKVLFDRGWGKASETHHIDVNGETSLLKVVNEIVHVHETREQIEFCDQTPLLELVPERTVPHECQRGRDLPGREDADCLDQIFIPFSALKTRIDLLFSPKWVIPLVLRCKTVTVVPDVGYYLHPEFYGLKDILYLKS